MHQVLRDFTALRVALICCTTALMVLPASQSKASSVAYRVQFVNGFGCHVVQVDLSNPRVKVSPVLSLRFPGGAEPMMTICSREQPVAAVTGTFFSKTTLLPIGDIVVDGRLVYFGGMGSAIALTPDNRVFFRRLPYGRRQDWGAFESVLACGPMLLERGQVALAPVHERFRDPRVLGRASRVAVGVTAHNKLLLVATREQVSLWELAKIMRDLGSIDAINLDGGTSTGMYYRGAAKVNPGRSMVNMLAVYENVAPESRTALRDSPAERDAISSYRAATAYRVYMQAQTPLATGRLADAVRLLARAAELDPLNASYQVRLAETLMRQGDDRASSVAWARAGQILLDKAHYREALERFQSALAIDPDSRIALQGLPQAYRGLGMETRARTAEYNLTLWDLKQNLVASHRGLMIELTLNAFALSRKPVPGTLPGPTLAEVIAQDVYVDVARGVRMELPSGWEFADREESSALTMRHRRRPWLGHLRAVWVPANASLARLVELYWAGSFQHEVSPTPVLLRLAHPGSWETSTTSTIGAIYCETEFVMCEGLLWILSRTAPETEREAAASDFRRLARCLTFF